MHDPISPRDTCREIISVYCREVRLLGLRLLGAISLGLGLEEVYVEKVLGEQEQHMAVNYYPRCPEPDLTYGLPKHTDPNALTILLMDPHVSGLQVLRDGAKWIAVDPRPNALVINLGDQLQVINLPESPSATNLMQLRDRSVD
jgi:isopenicillin N synthase-like dioxygenase